MSHLHQRVLRHSSVGSLQTHGKGEGRQEEAQPRMRLRYTHTVYNGSLRLSGISSSALAFFQGEKLSLSLSLFSFEFCVCASTHPPRSPPNHSLRTIPRESFANIARLDVFIQIKEFPPSSLFHGTYLGKVRYLRESLSVSSKHDGWHFDSHDVRKGKNT